LTVLASYSRPATVGAPYQGSISGSKGGLLTVPRRRRKGERAAVHRSFNQKGAEEGKIREGRTMVEGCFGTKGCRKALRMTRTNDL